MLELANVRIIESCHKNSSRPSVVVVGRKAQESAFLHCFPSLNEDMVHFYRVYSRMRRTFLLADQAKNFE